MNGQRCLVLGMGVSGRSAALFLLKQGAEVFAYDIKEGLRGPDIEALESMGLQWISIHSSIGVDNFDLAVVSPGVPPNDFLYKKILEAKIPFCGEIELAFRSINNPIIGVTGTNGKTTVCHLTAHILNSGGIPAKVLGNSGIALSSVLNKPMDGVVVCELSSYQIETLSTKKLDAAAILNITEDHLDRYRTMERYAAAKIRIKDGLKEGAPLLVREDISSCYGAYLTGTDVRTFDLSKDADISKDFIDDLLPIAYRGTFTHDVENMMAAYGLSKVIGIDDQIISNSYDTFSKPPHRIQLIKQIRGIKFYNDSKGTNVDAMKRAVESMQGAVHLIAGGKAKGASFKSLLPGFKGKVKTIAAIGEAKEQIVQEFGNDISVVICATLNEAVERLFDIARESDNVLLSPGCASFDMFKNFEHRGECFVKAVDALALQKV